MASWLINGLSVADIFGKLTAETTWKMGTANRRTVAQLPGIHGSLALGLPVLDEPTVTLDVLFRAATEAQLEEAVTHFQALCATPTVTLTRVSGGVTTTADASLVSVGHDGWVPGASSHLTVVFAIPGAMFRGPLVGVDDVVFSGALVAHELEPLSGSSAPIGDAVARITGPATSVSLTDPSSGTGMSWSGTLTAGQYLFLRARPLMARISSVSTDWWAGGTDVLGQIDYPSAGRLQLFPVVQSATVRKIQISASGTGLSGASRISVLGRQAHL